MAKDIYGDKDFQFLDEEEKEIIQDMEKAGIENFKDNEEETSQMKRYLSERQTVTFSMPKRLVQSLRKVAAEKGLKYQVLATTVLKQYTENGFIDVKEFEKSKKLLNL